MPNNLMIARVSPNGPVRTATYQGQPHLVAPVIALVETVVNGVLAPAEALEASVLQWNGVPLLIGHPSDPSGQAISANQSPAVAEGVIGRLWNCTVSQGRLRGELWLSIAQAEAAGGVHLDTLERLRQGSPLEVSTGFFADVLERSGTHQGQAYTGVYANIRPDHLALLPDGTGACSWSDGCGAPRLHTRVLAALSELVSRREPVHVQQTDSDVRRALYALLAQEQGTLTTPLRIDLLDMTGQACVYRLGERQFMRQYTMGEDGALTMAPEVRSVQTETRLVPVGEALPPPALPHQGHVSAFAAQGGEPVAKEPLIETLMHQVGLVQPTLRTELAVLSEEILQRLVTHTVPAVLATTPQDALARLPEGPVRATLTQALAAHDAQKTALIQALVAAQCPVQETELQAQPLATLERYAQMMRLQAAGPPPDYAGQGMAAPREARTEDHASWTPRSLLAAKTTAS
jgi:hypothetical protein